MDLALTANATLSPEEGRRLRRVMLGVGLSILVHGALLTAWRGGASPADRPEPPRSIAVRIQPPPPPRVETPEPPPPAPAPTPRAERPAPAPVPTRKPSTPRAVIAVSPDTERAGEPDPFIIEQPETPPAPSETPRFDREAAKRSARALANMRDPAKEGTAVGQFPEKPLETETKAARVIGAAKRANCKDGLPGGLLAPLLLLADKKDSGCKW